MAYNDNPVYILFSSHIDHHGVTIDSHFAQLISVVVNQLKKELRQDLNNKHINCNTIVFGDRHVAVCADGFDNVSDAKLLEQKLAKWFTDCKDVDPSLCMSIMSEGHYDFPFQESICYGFYDYIREQFVTIQEVFLRYKLAMSSEHILSAKKNYVLSCQ